MNEFSYGVCISWFFAICFVRSNVISNPQVIEIVAGQTAYLNCSTNLSDKRVLWYHYAVGAHESSYVYLMGSIQPSFAKRFQVERDNTPGEFNLVITNVKSGDDGRYICQEDTEAGEYSSMELIVLGSKPVCETNTNAGGVIGNNHCGIEPEELMFSCSVTYHGNIAPELQLKAEGTQVIRINETRDEKNFNRVTSTAKIRADIKINGSNFVCETRSSHHSCSSGPIRVLYAIGGNMTEEKIIGDDVECSAYTNQPCSYNWKHTYGAREFDVSYVGQNSTPGWYKCEATCVIREKPCVFDVKWILLSKADGHGLLTTRNFAITLGVVFGLILLLCIVHLLWKLRTCKPLLYHNCSFISVASRTPSNGFSAVTSYRDRDRNRDRDRALVTEESSDRRERRPKL